MSIAVYIVTHDESHGKFFVVRDSDEKMVRFDYDQGGPSSLHSDSYHVAFYRPLAHDNPPKLELDEDGKARLRQDEVGLPSTATVKTDLHPDGWLGFVTFTQSKASSLDPCHSA